jgi:hypothetical protein
VYVHNFSWPLHVEAHFHFICEAKQNLKSEKDLLRQSGKGFSLAPLPARLLATSQVL